MNEQLRFEDTPRLLVELTNEIRGLKEIVSQKLTTPEGYEPDITMDVNEAAEYLRCTPDNVYKKVRSGILSHHKSGKLIFFKKKELDEATKPKLYKRRVFK